MRGRKGLELGVRGVFMHRKSCEEVGPSDVHRGVPRSTRADLLGDSRAYRVHWVQSSVPVRAYRAVRAQGDAHSLCRVQGERGACAMDGRVACEHEACEQGAA